MFMTFIDAVQGMTISNNLPSGRDMNSYLQIPIHFSHTYSSILFVPWHHQYLLHSALFVASLYVLGMFSPLLSIQQVSNILVIIPVLAWLVGGS
jgi:hypothetical protein